MCCSAISCASAACLACSSARWDWAVDCTRRSSSSWACLRSVTLCRCSPTNCARSFSCWACLLASSWAWASASCAQWASCSAMSPSVRCAHWAWSRWCPSSSSLVFASCVRCWASCSSICAFILAFRPSTALPMPWRSPMCLAIPASSSRMVSCRLASVRLASAFSACSRSSASRRSLSCFIVSSSWIRSSSPSKYDSFLDCSCLNSNCCSLSCRSRSWARLSASRTRSWNASCSSSNCCSFSCITIRSSSSCCFFFCFSCCSIMSREACMFSSSRWAMVCC
mmetsp:Transcript_60897/g.108670  ORF Transcript_60897/g.108670 Transcript_60897/m.108670 type:complete len:282 (+) Transcript_60897:1353-2198(+)